MIQHLHRLIDVMIDILSCSYIKKKFRITKKRQNLTLLPSERPPRPPQHRSTSIKTTGSKRRTRTRSIERDMTQKKIRHRRESSSNRILSDHHRRCHRQEILQEAKRVLALKAARCQLESKKMLQH